MLPCKALIYDVYVLSCTKVTISFSHNVILRILFLLEEKVEKEEIKDSIDIVEDDDEFEEFDLQNPIEAMEDVDQIKQW